MITIMAEVLTSNLFRLLQAHRLMDMAMNNPFTTSRLQVFAVLRSITVTEFVFVCRNSSLPQPDNTVGYVQQFVSLERMEHGGDDVRLKA